MWTGDFYDLGIVWRLEGRISDFWRFGRLFVGVLMGWRLLFRFEWKLYLIGLFNCYLVNI